MKHVVAHFLISAILLHLLAEFAVLVSFKINQDYIAEFLCINRNVPESNCNGCCHLKKELNEQQENKENLPESEIKKIEIQYFADESEFSKNKNKNPKPTSFFYLNNTGILNPDNIFHPPQKRHT